MRKRIWRMHAWGWGCIAFGALLYADALGRARAYGGTWGDGIEFIVATVVVVAGAWLAYLSGIWSARMLRASRPRRIARQ